MEHPALPTPFERDESGWSAVSMASLGRSERVCVAVQLVSVTELLSDFELWPGRSALRQAVLEGTDHGLRVRLPALPVPISRIWSRLGGGDPAAEGTRSAVLATIAELTGLEADLFSHGGTEPGFFLDGVLARLLGELDQPLDEATARALWMWRWSLPPMPEIGDTNLFAVPNGAVARRLGAAAWAATVRRGEGATLEVARPENGPAIVADSGGARAVRVIAGTFDDRLLTTIIDRKGDRELATIALGRFPNGWNPVPAPVYDPERLAVHLAVAGLSPARKLRFIDSQAGRFDIFSPADRRSMTRSAAMVFSEPRHRNTGRFRELVGVAGLAPEGVPVAKALEVSGVDEDHLEAACDARVVIRRRDRVMLPSRTSMVADPRHAELVDLFERDDPRRLLHAALASGNTGDLLAWTRGRLDELDARAVRRALAGLAVGALGPGVQVALVEACLSLADIHGARRALAGLGDEIARPWKNWLRLIDRPPEFEVECPRPIDLHQAPRACAEIALINVRRALWWRSESAEAPLDMVRQAMGRLNGMARRWVEIKLTALVEPDRLDDAKWRRVVSEGHPELLGLILFEQSLRAAFEDQPRLAGRLLRRVMSAERAPGRLAVMQVNLGDIEARLGRPQDAEALTLGAFRLFQTAGFQRRGWDALHNLAVADIDQLRVDRATARLDAVAEAESTLFVQAERARLALAMGDLDLFRSRLEELPAISDLATAQIVQALAFLYGVEALFFNSPAAALPMLREGGDEAVAWVDLVEAVIGIEGGGRPEMDDGWGVGRATALVRSIQRSGPEVDLAAWLGDELQLKDAFAVALCHRLGLHHGRELRHRAAAILDDHGLRGWAVCLRWDSKQVEDLLNGLSKVVRNRGLNRLDESVEREVLVPLGVEGLVVRSARNGRELLRVGKGDPFDGDRRGSLEVIPLGSAPISASAWRLLAEVLDLTHSPSSVSRESCHRSEVRIDGVSLAVERLREEVRLAAGPRFTVLIHGETGSGKEVVAREIHRLSGRTGELVSVNVAAVPANLLEAELFGSVKGAFTGADRSRRGLVSAADGGTLFLDEVGDLDVALQVKLLRFLESREVRAVGSDRTNRVDVRVVCATHRNLERRVREGRFREDLYYRIALAKVRVPALRERSEDIPILRSIFEEEASDRQGLQIAPWTAAAERRLMDHRWPGNVRELKITIEVAMSRASGETIRPEHLPLMQGGSVKRGTWETTLADFKRDFLREVLTRQRGNRSAAARELGISRQALLYQIKKLGLSEV